MSGEAKDVRQDPRVWSLRHELAAIEAALHGAAWIVEMLPEHAIDHHSMTPLANAAAAIITAVELRVRDLGRVLHGELDPTHPFADHNAVPRGDTKVNSGRDVVFGTKR